MPEREAAPLVLCSLAKLCSYQRGIRTLKRDGSVPARTVLSSQLGARAALPPVALMCTTLGKQTVGRGGAA